MLPPEAQVIASPMFTTRLRPAPWHPAVTPTVIVEGGVAREEGYRWVQRCAFAARDEGGSFRELVGKDPDIRKILDEKHLTAVFDPKRALAHTGAIVDRALSVRPRLPEAPPLLDS